MKRPLLLLLGALVALLVCGADEAPTPAEHLDALLLQAPTPEALRASLAADAHEVAAKAPEVAGDAWHLVGDSWARAGEIDSAVVALEHAFAASGLDNDRTGLADLLLRRRGPGDVDRALALLRGRTAPAGRGLLSVDREGLIGWAQVLAGHPDSAVTLFKPYRMFLSELPLWRFRMGRALLEAGDPRGAFDMLLPLEVSSRRQDNEVSQLMNQIGQKTGISSRLDMAIGQAILAHDKAEKLVLDAMGGRRVAFPARDGFNLGGVLLAPPGNAVHRAAIVLMSPPDSLAGFDSLATALRASGTAVLLLDVRGSGWSVGPSCPAMDTWEGREDRMQERVVRDIGAALTYLAAHVPVDTTRYLVGAVGTSTPIAVKAAAADPRIAALLLISPAPTEVERGPMRAMIAKRRIPVFYQLGPEDGRDMPITEAFYEAADERTSRISDSRRVGKGPMQFHYEPEVVTRFIRWYDESIPPAGKRSPRPR